MAQDNLDKSSTQLPALVQKVSIMKLPTSIKQGESSENFYGPGLWTDSDRHATGCSDHLPRECGFKISLVV